MVNQFQFLEENEWDYDPVEEEEDEPDFDQIVAQNLTDQQFIEQNVQLPTSEPAPEVVVAPPPAAEPAYNQPQDRGPQAPSGYGAPPEPAPAQPLSLAEMLLQEQNTFLPNQGAPDPFMDWAYNESPLAQQIEQQRNDEFDLNLALGSALSGDVLFDENMTPERLDQMSNSRNFGVGPLAGLNYQIVEDNRRLEDIIGQLDAMNPENFTTQAEIDAYNDLIERGTRIEADLNHTIQRYQEIGGELIAEQEDLHESLYGDEGSLRRFNKLYGPGGLAAQSAIMGEGMVGAGLEPEATPAINRDLYNMLRSGQATTTSLDEAMGGTAYKLTEAGEQAIQGAIREQAAIDARIRRQRQTLELGFTSEQFGQMADDPGFQEFLSQVTPLDVPDELLASLDVNQLAGIQNPYGGGDPVPLQSILPYAPGSRTEDSVLKSLILAPFMPLTLIPGSEQAFNVLDAPAQAAGRGAYDMARDIKDLGMIVPDLLTTGSADVSVLASTSTGRQQRLDEDYERFQENHPWISLGNEIVHDPLNALSLGVFRSVYKATRFSKDARLIRNSTSLAVEQAARENTIASRRYLEAVADVGSGNISKIDGFKLARTEDRFATVAKNSLGVGNDAATVFGNRMTYRLHASPETSWSNILNEELGRLAEANGKTIDARTANVFNRELGSEQAFSLLDGNEFWKNIGAEFPKVMQDTPQWRRGRQQNLPNPDNALVPQGTGPAALDDLVAVGYGPNLALDERWASHAEASRSRSVIPGDQYTLKYFTPTAAPIRSEGVSEDMITSLRRAYDANGKSLDSVPATRDEYWDMWRKLDDVKNEKFTPTHTPDDVLRNPYFQTLYANSVGDLTDGVIPRYTDRPATISQISTLQAASFIQSRDLLGDFLSPTGGLGAPGSQTRFNYIYDRLPATEWKKAQVRKIAESRGLKVPDTLDSMSFKDVNAWVARYNRDVKQPGDVKTIHMGYVQGLSDMIQHNRDDIFRQEFRAVIADLMLPSGEGRYEFTRPAIRPNGTTANGWARLTTWELLDAIEKASANITHLEHFGPAIDELAETVRRMRGIRSGQRTAPEISNVTGPTQMRFSGRRQFSQESSRYPVLLSKAEEILEDIVDDVLLNASPAEVYDFKNWLVNLYDKSYLGRPGRKASPRDALPDSPEVYQFDQTLGELAARQSERAMIDDKMARFRSVTTLTEFTHNGQKHSLDWKDLIRRPRDEAVSLIHAHFDNPNSPMTRDGFSDLLRQVDFYPPGGRRRGARDALDQLARMDQARGRMTREIVEWGNRAQRMGEKLGVNDLSNLTNLSKEPMIQHHLREFTARMPEYAQYDPNFTLPNIGGDATRTLLKTSSQETTAAAAEMLARGRARPAWHQTTPVWEAKIFEGRDRYISKGSWEGSPELNERLGRAFATYNQTSANRMPVNEIAANLTSTNIPFRSDDLSTQALLIHGYSFKEIADAAGISQNAAKRLRQAINNELTQGTSLHPVQIAEDAKAMREAIGIADTFYNILNEQPRRVGDEPLTKIELVAGKLKIPNNLVDPLLSYLDDQYKLRLLHQPGELTQAAAESTRKTLGLVLDYMIFGVTDRATSHKVMSVLGPGGSQYIQPRHQRPVVPVFDPLGSRLGQINWTLHGSAFDQVINAYYEVDPVWGKSVTSRIDPRNMGELTKLSKGTKIGDLTSFIGHTVFHNVLELAHSSRENIADIYTDIINQMDEIVYGGANAQMLYGSMFGNSEEMSRWLTWARQQVRQDMVKPDGTGAIKSKHVGLTMWDVVKDNWGDITPHLSISQMPPGLRDQIFAPTPSGITRRKRTLNRAPVADDITRLDDFINDFTNFTKDLDLNEFERMEAELWHKALEPRWGEIQTQFRSGVGGEFYRGVHVDDLDALFNLDAKDPFDAQRFADKMGTVASRIELERLGFTDVSFGLKMSQAIKATFGFFWLRAAPRYIINNVFGNLVSLILNQSRSDRALGLRKQGRMMDGLSYKNSSLYNHRMMSAGLTSTEYAWGGPQGVARDRTKPDALQAVFREKAEGRFARARNSSALRTAGHHTRRLSKAYFDFNADLTDWFEIDARSRVWTNEFEFHYQNMWDEGLSGIDIDPAVREQLSGQIELSDISRILNDAGVEDTQRTQVFRAYNVSSSDAHLRAYSATKDVMRDYLMRNRFDNLLDQIFPYHFWMTKNLMFVTGTVMDRPATVLQGARLYDAWEETWQDLPYSFRERIHIKKVPGFVPGLGGREIGIRPNNITNPAFLILPAVVDEMSDAWKRYEDMPIYERFARTTAGGAQTLYEEMGYSPGPHIDLITGVTTSKAVDQMAKDMGGDEVAFWKDQFDRGLMGVTNPQGYDRELVPLGGLEDVALWQVGDKDVMPGDKKRTVRSLYAWMNRNVKGSDFTTGEVTAMGYIAYEMLREGTITEDEFNELKQLTVEGNYDQIESNPLGSAVLERMYKNQGERAGINYGSALSFSELRPMIREAVEAQDQYLKLKAEDEEIPIPKDATTGQSLAIRGFNKQIQELRDEAEEFKEVRNFSPDAVSEGDQMFSVGLRKIYSEAKKAGIEVPQLDRFGPDAALDYVFGPYNPQTRKREGGAAPWIEFYWAANDNAEDLALARVRDARYEERAQKREANNQLWREREERSGKAAPYWEQIEANYENERVQIADIKSRGLSPAAEMRLIDAEMDKTKRNNAKVFDAAEQEGISLRGFGGVPFHTSAWYDLSESSNRDVRYMYEQMGLGVPRDRELISVEQAIALNSVQDQVNAHTTWAMRQTIDAADLNPYLPNGEPNPRFMRNGYFSRELWEETVKAEAPEIMRLYDGIVRSYVDPERGMTRRADYGQAEPVDLLARRDLEFEEMFEFLKDDVLPRQTAYDMGLSAALDRYFNASGDERERIYQQGVVDFGATFMDIANQEQVKVDMDEVATTITNFYNGLTGNERTSFEEQWGEHIVDGGDIRVIDSETLTYNDALLIADRYGLEIPTYRSEWDMSNKRHALSSVWDQLSSDQQSALKETWAEDETLPDGFILTVSGTDDESGEPYTYTLPVWEELNEPQIAKLIRQLDAPVDSYYPDENELQGTANARTPRFEKMLADAARDKEVQVVEQAFWSGEAFLSDPKDVEGWQSVQALRDQYPDLYDAGKKLIDENGVSWEWLVENLEPRPKEGGDDTVTLREFAEMYTYTLDEADYGRLINERRKWLRDEGQEYPSLIQYLDDRDPTVEDALMQAEAGTLYGFEGEDLENWQEFYAWREAHDHLYYAASAIKNENDVTWAELAAGLEDGAIKQFAQDYLKRIEDYDMGRLWDQRSAFFATEYGQSLTARDPDEFAGLVDLGSGGSSSGGGRSSGGGSSYSRGGRSFGSSGSSQRRPPSSSGKTMTDFPTDIRDVFRLDSGMMTGDAPDSQARYDVAIEVAELIQKRLALFDMILGPNNDMSRVFMQLYMRNITSMLGENPTLDLWQQVLRSLGGGQSPAQPSEELLAEEALTAAD